ncbi:hypothetical protein HY025_03020 [Candidatus Daviesbacteria bacterium]|nr:hypothetical protein [Candidatus Daviesbacteria bacterium]
MLNLKLKFKKNPKQRINKSIENSVVNQVRKVLRDVDQKLIVMVRS